MIGGQETPASHRCWKLLRIHPYWFAPRFCEAVLVGAPLPLDQHHLIAIIAPARCTQQARARTTTPARRVSSPLSSRLLPRGVRDAAVLDRKSTRLNSRHVALSYAVFCVNNKT